MIVYVSSNSVTTWLHSVGIVNQQKHLLAIICAQKNLRPNEQLLKPNVSQSYAMTNPYVIVKPPWG